MLFGHPVELLGNGPRWVAQPPVQFLVLVTIETSPNLWLLYVSICFYPILPYFSIIFSWLFHQAVADVPLIFRSLEKAKPWRGASCNLQKGLGEAARAAPLRQPFVAWRNVE